MAIVKTAELGLIIAGYTNIQILGRGLVMSFVHAGESGKVSDKPSGSYHICAIVAVICWASVYPFTRLAIRYFSVYSLGFMRFLTASVILAVVAAARGMAVPPLRDWCKFAAAGATGFFLHMITFNTGMVTETSATASIISAISPIVTAIISRVLYGEFLRPIQWAAMAVEFAGILILVLRNGVMSVGSGVPWLLGMAFSLGTFNLQQRRLVLDYTGLQASIFSVFAGTIMLSIFAPVAIRETLTAPVDMLFYVVVLGVSSAVAYVSWSMAFERAPNTASVSNYMFVTPFLASLLGFLVSDECPDFSTIAGGSVILCGVFVYNTAGRVKMKDS
jgi:drug/metabolite transporter (DMT)-like permease